MRGAQTRWQLGLIYYNGVKKHEIVNIVVSGSVHNLAFVLFHKFVDKFLFHSTKVFLTQTNIALKLFMELFVRDSVVCLLILEFDEPTKRLKASMESNPFYQQVKLTRNHV